MSMGDICITMCMAMLKAELNLFERACLPGPFISQGRVVTLRPRARQVTLGWLKLYTVGL
jgi:hypothetical protein